MSTGTKYYINLHLNSQIIIFIFQLFFGYFSALQAIIYKLYSIIPRITQYYSKKDTKKENCCAISF